MKQNLITFSTSANTTISAGNYTIASSLTPGISLSKFFVVKCFASLRLLDSNSQNIAGKCLFAFRTANASNSYSSLIPGLSLGYQTSIRVVVTDFSYFECGFTIQPGDQTRIEYTFYLDAIAATNVNCLLDVSLVGYQID